MSNPRLKRHGGMKLTATYGMPGLRDLFDGMKKYAVPGSLFSRRANLSRRKMRSVSRKEWLAGQGERLAMVAKCSVCRDVNGEARHDKPLWFPTTTARNAHRAAA